MRIVTLDAIRGAERLAAVGLYQARVFGIMAVEAERRRGLRQMVIEFNFATFAGLVCDVAGPAAHVQRGVAAAALGNVHTFRVAGQAKIVLLGCTVGRQQQVILVSRSVRVVAFDAITNRRRMNLSVDGGGILVGVAGNTQRLRGGGEQLHAGCIFVCAYLVTAHATHGNRRVDRLAFGFVFVTLNARSGISFGVERDGVQRCLGGHGDDRERQHKDGGGDHAFFRAAR